jgi:hypothetical protein
MAPSKPCNVLCTVAAAVSCVGLGGLVVFAFIARGRDDEIDLGTVLDASVIVTTVVCTTFALWWFARLVAPLWKDLQSIRWELQRTRQELYETRKQVIETQPSAKAIAGYAVAALLTDEDEGATVVNLRG